MHYCKVQCHYFFLQFQAENIWFRYAQYYIIVWIIFPELFIRLWEFKTRRQHDCTAVPIFSSLCVVGRENLHVACWGWPFYYQLGFLLPFCFVRILTILTSSKSGKIMFLPRIGVQVHLLEVSTVCCFLFFFIFISLTMWLLRPTLVKQILCKLTTDSLETCVKIVTNQNKHRSGASVMHSLISNIICQKTIVNISNFH